MKGTIQKWKLVILLDALLFLSNMTFAKDTINQYTEGNPIDTTSRNKVNGKPINVLRS